MQTLNVNYVTFKSITSKIIVMKIVLFVSFLSFIVFESCSKSGGNGTSNIAPTNLQITAVVNPDNSGSVAFTATATNAVSYEFNFGNGAFLAVPSGIYTYKYSASDTYIVTVVAKSAGGQSVSGTAQVTINIPRLLVWSEEFNTNGAPDPLKWGYDLGAGGWGNNELQHYTLRPQNVIVTDGKLKITAKRETFSGAPFTSARILSKDKYSFKYGKVDILAKFPAGVGTWPALWTLGSNISTLPWPACGEIDIAEHVGKNLNRIYGTLHYPLRFGGNADGNSVIINNATTEFHKYSVDWSSLSIKIFVDDVLYHTVKNSNALPFNANFFFILNIAIGGDFGGPVEAAFNEASMEVDYIRVYQ